MTGLMEYAGKRWGLVKHILAALPKSARVDAGRIYDWVRRGLLAARRNGRALVIALEDVLEVERSTRQTAAKRGGAKRGSATVLA